MTQTHDGPELLVWTNPFNGQRLLIDPWAPNPLATGYQLLNPQIYALAVTESPVPTMFNTGDVPPFLASGLDPRILLQLPWQTRHALAQSPTTLEVYNAMETYTGSAKDPDGIIESAALTDYIRRVDQWITGRWAGNTDPRATGGSSDVSLDDDLYDAMFGAVEAHAKAQTAGRDAAALQAMRNRMRLGNPAEPQQ